MRARHGLAPDTLVLLSVGRLEFNKGFDVLVDALALAVKSGTFGARPWRWVIAGDGPFRGSLDTAIATLGLSAHVITAGRVSESDLHAWYEAATVFVHPTRYEGSSLVTLEAMAHRRAVVATRAGGLPDKVRPGETGWLVAPGDVSALAAAIAEAAADPARLDRWGRAGRALVEAEFDWPVLADRHIALYNRLLGSR